MLQYIRVNREELPFALKLTENINNIHSMLRPNSMAGFVNVVKKQPGWQ